jgi:hypothetical protein
MKPPQEFVPAFLLFVTLSVVTALGEQSDAELFAQFKEELKPPRPTPRAPILAPPVNRHQSREAPKETEKADEAAAKEIASQPVVIAQEMVGYIDVLQKCSTEMPLNSAYKENLQSLLDALHQIKQTPKSSENEERANRLLADLKNKAEAAKNNPARPFDLIRVTVRTTHEVRVVNGCEVYYVPQAWKNTPDRFRHFDKLSSPTEQLLPPGYYILWSKVKGHPGQYQTLIVGASDLHGKVVDLDAFDN